MVVKLTAIARIPVTRKFGTAAKGLACEQGSGCLKPSRSTQTADLFGIQRFYGVRQLELYDTARRVHVSIHRLRSVGRFMD